MSTQLSQIAKKAKLHRTVRFELVSSHIASSGMKRRSSQKSSGEPSAGNLHAGFCLGRRVQEAMLAR
jgi:hypothetical protein